MKYGIQCQGGDLGWYTNDLEEARYWAEGADGDAPHCGPHLIVEYPE